MPNVGFFLKSSDSCLSGSRRWRARALCLIMGWEASGPLSVGQTAKADIAPVCTFRQLRALFSVIRAVAAKSRNLPFFHVGAGGSTVPSLRPLKDSEKLSKAIAQSRARLPSRRCLSTQPYAGATPPFKNSGINTFQNPAAY